MSFTPEEDSIMEKDLKYNLEQLTKWCLENFVVETDSAIQQINFYQHEAIRFMATNIIQKLMRTPQRYRWFTHFHSSPLHTH
jgi:hypothetical protein